MPCMRVLVLVVVMVSLIGCDLGGSTGPYLPAIVVRVSDDRGAPADRMPVVVTLSSGRRIETRTGPGGAVRVRLPEAGTHRVTVIPRADYVSPSGALTRNVTVGD